MKFIIASLIGIAISNAANSAAAQTPDIREFVHQIYIEGVPYEEVTRFNPSTAAPVLLEMLENPQEEGYWTNVVVTLGMLGDERAVEPLIRFVEEGVGQLSRDQYAAKTSAVMSLGYIVNKSKSARALSYLTEGIDPDIWSRRVNWSSPYHSSEVGRNQQLITMSILGLGLTGHPQAAEFLRSLRTSVTSEGKRLRTYVPRLDDVGGEARKANESIARDGLARYYRKDRPSLRRP